MTTLTLTADPIATHVEFSDRAFTVHLGDRRQLTIPIDWYPRLQYATPDERNHWELLGDGYAIQWAQLDEHIGIEGLLAGQPSGESQASFERWLESRRPS
ncbi:MAG: DUF2442 domain-containing protein [Cyanobacteria bacterium P01_D01_bin.73]